MKEQSRLGIRALKRAVQLATATLAIAGSGVVGGCLSRPIEPVDPRTTSVVVERLTQSGVNKIDLVLVVDNSASMADKQYILSLAIPDLIVGLVNPKCLDTMGNPVAMQPAGPLDACPTGSTREFPPVTDIHIGLLSSSLGSFGADGCPDKPPASCPTAATTSNNDHGHLVTRTDPCGSGTVPTYQSSGFLAWDPAMKLNPAGTTDVGGIGMGGIVGALHDLVVGDGQLGCGFESQNESWYRFLVDPTPYQSIALVNNQVQLSGIDNDLLKQRADFLRPDSLLAIINVTDENDTSIKEYSSYPLFAAPELHLPHARQECTTKGPTDPCCASCGQPTPSGCQPDPMCMSNPSYTMADENTSLRAFGLITHKQRYGIEFFYQPSRYVDALTKANVTDVNNKQVPNPIFSNLKPGTYTGAVRDPGLVFYAAIVGVPWQLIARQNNGQPDLINGKDALDPTQVGGFKTSKELDLLDAKGNTFWDDIAGDPENYVFAKSPFMVESTTPRSGTDPITGAAISPVGTANGSGSQSGGAVLNDHERTIKTPADDIEYACIFDLPPGHTVDCTQPGVTCDCPMSAGSTTDNPLCNGTTQVRAKAYPGVKHLAIARGMGTQGIAASICPKQLTDDTQPDFGYRPAVKAIIDRLKQALHGECLPRQLTPDATGQVQCLILEARNAGGMCNCDAASGRLPVSADHQPAVVAAQADPLAQTSNWDCFCEIQQVPASVPAGMPVVSPCQTDQSVDPSINGWCYIDPSLVPSTAPSGTVTKETDLVKDCPATEEHNIRFVNKGNPQTGATLFITCAGS